MIHLDVKKVGHIRPGGRLEDPQTHPSRGEGLPKRGKSAWTGHTYLHSAIEAFSHLACTEALDDETTSTTIGFLRRARSLPRPSPPWLTPPEDPPLHPCHNGKVERYNRILATTASWPKSASTCTPMPHSSSAATSSLVEPPQLPSPPHRLPQPTRYLVGGPGWSGAGPAAVGTGVLPLSVDDPGGRKSPAAAGRW